MLKALLPISVFLLFTLQLKGQDEKRFGQDYFTAEKLNLNQTYSFPLSSEGFGNSQELVNRSDKASIYFEKERNTAWFTIDIPINGLLTFEIIPLNINDDYDFMLFEDEAGKSFSISQNKLLRSNNSRNDKSIGSKTGLKEGFNNLYEKPGPGASFSKPLAVKKGERLILVTDNIYDHGSGFTIRLNMVFEAQQTALLSGMVKDKIAGLPLQASIEVEDDSTGLLLAKFKTDTTGKFAIPIPLNRPLNVIASKKDYLFATERIVAQAALQQNLLLDRIAAGNKLIFYNIHFPPNKDNILPSSDPALERLIQFLKDKPRWIVRIIGHTNNNVFASSRYLQQLSFNRALAVKRVLLANGISESRISCAGMGGKEPIIITKDPVEGMKNLRVEVVLQREGME